eukprot:TRINITY_DN15772_c0_g2_i1.p1 TRINITY_DN15772_c0_g2~~TRINITY_DN15772_c0_g2_i1.p1  ORF type:complete len:128 (-),score=41.01 TRINITY_DN15772_c0_g2_i1:200-583(-)
MSSGVANTPQDSIHLRIKRKNTTVFLLCYPEQHVSEVKRKVAMMFNRDESTFRLMYKDMELADAAPGDTIRAQQVSSNDVVHLVYKMDNGDQYEKIEFDDLIKSHADYELKQQQAAQAAQQQAAPPA